MSGYLHRQTGEHLKSVELPAGCTISEVRIAGSDELVERVIVHPGDGPGRRQLLDHWRHPHADELLAASTAVREDTDDDLPAAPIVDWWEAYPELVPTPPDRPADEPTGTGRHGPRTKRGS